MELTREQVRELDRRAIEEFGIPGIILMENAGRAAALEVLNLAGPAGRVAILCGKGNNGGDGYVVARHLHNQGLEPHVFVFGRLDEIAGDAATNLSIIRRMNLFVTQVVTDDDLPKVEAMAGASDVVVDALLGTGAAGEPRGLIRRGIEVINRSGKAVVAIDIPSGLDANSGEALGPCVRADVTVTFVAAKAGFSRGQGPSCVGRVVTAEISIPRQLL